MVPTSSPKPYMHCILICSYLSLASLPLSMMENLVLATCGAVVVVSHCWNHGLVSWNQANRVVEILRRFGRICYRFLFPSAVVHGIYHLPLVVGKYLPRAGATCLSFSWLHDLGSVILESVPTFLPIHMGWS